MLNKRKDFYTSYSKQAKSSDFFFWVKDSDLEKSLSEVRSQTLLKKKKK